jgi:hypothetical protein
MKSRVLVIGAILALAAPVFPQTWKTPAEESGYSAYTQNEDIARFLSLADAASKDLEVRIVGRTKGVDAYPAHDIFLAILSENGAGPGPGINVGKPTILLVASQHGNEQSAKEAVLRILRDIAFGDLKPALKKVNFLIVPQANPFGNRFDVRENEIGLDLNRDHIKLESESVRALHRVFREWMPEVSLDVHEKGDDYYRVSIGCVSNINIDQAIQAFSRKPMLAEIEGALASKRVPFHEYLVTEDLGVDTSSGARAPAPAASVKPEEMKRYSTTDLNDGRNSYGIYGTFSFIQEGASRHDLETLAGRSGWQYAGIRAFIESAALHAGEIMKIVRDSRGRLLERAAAKAKDDPVRLRMAYARDPKEPRLVIRQFAPGGEDVLGILKADKKAGEKIVEGDLTAPTAETRTVTEVVPNWFPLVEPVLGAARPAGYLIPSARQDIVETLLDHGVAVEMIARETMVAVTGYVITDLIPAEEDYLAPKKIEVSSNLLTIPAKKGDYWVSCVQAGADLIPCLLEPQSDYGFIRYRKFRLVPEKNSLFPIYRFETTPDALPTVPYKRWGRPKLSS